ncbi:UNKNOWN [Stylonychia lemnae]|uniref:MAPEG family protein n=1 Tax=Stylonychia lemnae TaxID=5949 RepID=A0A078B779_STYLE|nr:UNKNOWN [Stylonychia lemnae]|eukprot:CDW90264.1 UNKNOWN [Stylonychia lemnae]
MLALICLECFLTSAAISRKRKAFETVLENFNFQHLEEFGTKPTKGGYPDHGSGRVHMNYVEQLPIYVLIIFLAAIKTPYATLILSVVLFVSRILYALSYSIGGPNLRSIGAFPGLLAKVGLYYYSFYSAYSLIKYHPHFK